MSEYLLESGNGGSIANVAYSPCGVSSTSQLLYKESLNNLFKNGEHCLGRAVFAAKCSVIASNPTSDTIYGPAVLWTLFGDPALRIRHRISSAVEELNSGLGVRASAFVASVTPSPCDASTTIRISGSSPIAHHFSLSVYDASGRLVHSSLGIRNSSFRLDLRSMPAGVYVVRCALGADCASTRFVVRH
jgi:hypothetical protein